MNHNWKIYDISRTISDNIVKRVTYACESDYSGSSTRYVGDLSITGSASDPDYIPYANLTEGIVLSWVTGSINYTSVQTNNSQSVADQINAIAAVTESHGLPW